MYCQGVLLYLVANMLVNDTEGKEARGGPRLTHYQRRKEKNGLSWLFFTLVGWMQMWKALLGGQGYEAFLYPIRLPPCFSWHDRLHKFV